MSLFKRRSPSEDGPGDEAPDVAPDEPMSRDGDELIEDDGRDRTVRRPGEPTTGPFDVADQPGTEGRLDIGAIRLPLLEGAEVQLQLDEGSGSVTGAFVVHGESAVQLQAFAAPRGEGIWAQICDEIAAGIAQQGGTADPGTGPFGHELLARVPAQQPDGKVGFQPLRFTGVDGPRWLLRAVFHGRAAIEPEAAADLEGLVREVVVVRGHEPMGPRELLPLHLPEGAEPEPVQEAAADETPASAADLNPFERGPEITERR